MAKGNSSEISISDRLKKAIRRRLNEQKNRKLNNEAERFLVSAESAAQAVRAMPEGEERRKLSAELMEKDQQLRQRDEKLYKTYKKRLKSKYIKELIPAAYAAEAAKPIENKVVFMENGTFPSPSNKHLYEEILRQGKYDVKTFSLHIRAVSDVEYYQNALDYVREIATAKAVFLSTANPLLSQFDVRPETCIIQLWHGVGMFKKVGYSTMGSKGFGYSAKTREEYNDYRNYTDVTVAAEEQIWTFEDAFHISRDTGIFKPIGIARTDVFFDEEYRKKAQETLCKHYPACRDKKLILYAPTFRGSVGKAKAPDQLDINRMAERVPDNYVLLVRHHGLCKELPPIPPALEGKFAFDMNTNAVLSTDELMSIADILVTDYSSLAFEFAVMEKPMVFFAYDLEEYIDGRGMYYDYSEITPGPVCKTTDEIIDYIIETDHVFDVGEVRAFRDKYVAACDGHATERTIALIEQ